MSKLAEIYVGYLNNKLVGNDMKIGGSLIILVHDHLKWCYNQIPAFSGQTSLYPLRPG